MLCTGEIWSGQGPTGQEGGPIRCKRWSCPHCHETNRRQVIRLGKEGKPNGLLTLTVRSTDYPTPQDAAQALKRGLRLLRLRLKRSPRLSDFEFLAVFEKHKSGYPHLHLLLRGKFIPWKELRSMWEEITGSFMVDIRKINSNGLAAAYCAKYIGKDLSAFEGCKRWWRSHGYTAKNAEDYRPRHLYGSTERYEVNWHDLRFALRAEGWTVLEIGRDRYSLKPPPEGSPGLLWAVQGVRGRRAEALRRRP